VYTNQITMKFGILFLLAFIISTQAFCQSLRQKNKELEVEWNSQKEIAHSLFFRQFPLTDEIGTSEYRNKKSFLDLLELYNVTEDKKYELHALVNETNDSLIDWSQFYRYEEISLNQLNEYGIYMDRRGIFLIPMEPDDSGEKARNPEERNEFLNRQIAYYSELNPILKNTHVQLENRLADQQADSSKLASWNNLLLRTYNYCLEKVQSDSFKVEESKDAWLCDTVDDDEKSLEKLSDTRKDIQKPFVEMPKFPEGVEALKSYLELELRYAGIRPKDSHDSKKVHVKFVVTDNGEIRNLQITKGSDCSKCDTAVLKIIQSMPRWTPATKGENPVSFLFRLRIQLPQ
jgi:TonB family protein